MNSEARIKIPRLAIVVAVLLIAAIAGIIIVKSQPTEFPLSDLESLALTEHTETAINYLEEIDKDSETFDNLADYPLDRFIAFALEYNYNENDKTEISAKQIKKLIESIFDIALKTDDINNVGISPLLLDKNVTHDPVGKIYTLNPQTDKRIIADIPITKYIENKTFTDKDKTTYTVVYDKYTAKSPYDILPHLESMEGVNDYLNGNGKIKSLKDSITKSAAEKLGGPVKQTTIEFVLKDKKLLIKSIH
ncbi:hypothetical protein IKQ65_00800 [Candidatus Saccharibacteria bacterium]|nr:hypothetical protein [Candidatus Saccharibacteria bacterium]MBR6961990.1 hypothetical protein [Candidatus Saccharibacteria bacterium]